VRLRRETLISRTKYLLEVAALVLALAILVPTANGNLICPFSGE
jgi:hypothetical protein